MYQSRKVRGQMSLGYKFCIFINGRPIRFMKYFNSVVFFFFSFHCNILSCIIEYRKVIFDCSCLKYDSPPNIGALYTPSLDSEIDFRNRFTLNSVTSEHIEVGLQRVNDVIIKPP
jgi:hypothetical protein